MRSLATSNVSKPRVTATTEFPNSEPQRRRDISLDGALFLNSAVLGDNAIGSR